MSAPGPARVAFSRPTAPRIGRPLVLLVEDGHQHAMLLRLALMERGYAIIIVRTVDTAVAILRDRAKGVDALLVTLPPDAAARLREAISDVAPRVAIALGMDAEVARLAGYALALPRPVDFGELDTLLRAHLELPFSGARRRVSIRPGEESLRRGGARR
jgi:DNA-binding response OmpR family regulator